jgi:penicillin-binding protein 1A
LPDDALGEDVVAEYFREGEEPVFGITFDGGFAMGANLPLVTGGTLTAVGGQTIDETTGEPTTQAGQAAAGVISSGGLY